MNHSKNCPNCATPGMRVFHEVSGAPTNTCIQLTSASDAQEWPTGSIALGYCGVCQFVCNLAFEPRLTEYSGRYEETQGHSETFNRFHRKLAEDLVDRYNLRNKHVIEIGCGKGEFLALLCELGGNEGLGFDPGFDRERVIANERIKFVTDFYSEDYAGPPGDLVCCKMTLEHIPQTRQFVDMLYRSTVSSDTIIYFQVPDARRILRDCAFEDVYYEHCCYFTQESLSRLFTDAGFKVLEVRSEYDDQYLAIEATPAGGQQAEPITSAPDIERAIEDFPQRYAQQRARWNELVNSTLDKGQRIALWGAGSKAATFLHALERGAEVQNVVDINPHRQGHYMVGTAQRICGADDLCESPPDLVIVMNRIYVPEITTMLKERGLNPLVEAL